MQPRQASPVCGVERIGPPLSYPLCDNGGMMNRPVRLAQGRWLCEPLRPIRTGRAPRRAMPLLAAAARFCPLSPAFSRIFPEGFSPCRIWTINRKCFMLNMLQFWEFSAAVRKLPLLQPQVRPQSLYAAFAPEAHGEKWRLTRTDFAACRLLW